MSKLSVIIPVYQTQATLERCVGSVTGQSFSDLEIILVDDGSPDKCPALCDQLALQDRRITVVHKANGGLSDARNAGIQTARGANITFLDSDDYVAPDTYARLMDVLDRHPEYDMLEFPIWCLYGSPRQSLLTFDEHAYTDVADYWLGTRAYLHTYACNKIYRRKLFDLVRFPLGRVFEDAYTLPNILRHAACVATTEQGLYYYCWNGQGITATAQGPQLLQLLDAHLSGGMPVDDEYYMHLLNIQMDVYELTGLDPQLPYRKVTAISRLSSVKLKLKALVQNFLGINGICKVNKIIHRLSR